MLDDAKRLQIALKASDAGLPDGCPMARRWDGNDFVPIRSRYRLNLRED
jgi:hypothetical protein